MFTVLKQATAEHWAPIHLSAQRHTTSQLQGQPQQLCHAGRNWRICSNYSRGCHGHNVHSPEEGHFQAQPCHTAQAHDSISHSRALWGSLPEEPPAAVAPQGKSVTHSGLLAQDLRYCVTF